MREMLFTTCLILLLSLTTAAQGDTPKAELFGGYSYAGDSTHGFDASVAVNVNEWLGVVADFGRQFTDINGTDSREEIRTQTYLFGPQFSVRRKRKVTPFARALFGASRVKTEATKLGQTFAFSDTSFAMALGGGLDLRVNDTSAIRAIQIEYVRTGFFGETQNKGRISAGIVIRLGKK